MFYQTLYIEPAETESNTELSTAFLDNINIPKLNAVSQALCDEDITLLECSIALKEMPNNKSPGSDGFTTEFYKFFWPDIKELVFNSVKYAQLSEHLSIEQRRGVLSLIPKKDKDTRYLKNWRPISLLNTDYKIVAKVLSKRLQNVIDELVSRDQCGYIKGRYIGENIRTIGDIIDYSNLYRTNGIS